jgi:mRNA (2'-O-methyladenosine-N6-)-methyltransferase
LGRRSHDWINHSKEHCIIGIKGKPLIQQRIDCDVVVRSVQQPSPARAHLEAATPCTNAAALF